MMTVDEVALLLRVHPNTVYRAVGRGEIEAIRIGRSYRIPESAVAAHRMPTAEPHHVAS